METVNLLSKIEKYGCDNGLFAYTTIGNLSKSCCNSSKTEVIDFDTTKEHICKQHNLQTLKSCDALKFLTNASRIDFIEMKGFKEFISREIKETKEVEEKTKEKLTKFDFETKIRDSIAVLSILISSKSLSLSAQERNLFHKIDKHYVVLSDISIEKNPIDFLTMTLDFLGNASSNIEKKVLSVLEKELKNIKLSDFHNIHQPVLKNCENIDDYYS